VVLATKVHGKVGPGPNDIGNSRYHIMREVENSLRRLQTDHIDLYYLHRPDPDTPHEEEIRALDDLVHQGKIRYFGTSHYAAWQITHGLWLSDRHGLEHWVADQPRYSLLDRAIEQEVVPMAQALGYGLVSHSPLAGGFLTGKYQPGQAFPQDSRGAHNPDRYQAMLTENNLRVLETVRQTAKQHDTSPGNVAIAWVLAKPFITASIIGPRTLEQLLDNLAAAEVTLTPDEVAQLDEVSDFARSLVRT
jgi:aryl-alcohol dehydrogenase-like predicted oxidoreductase